MFVLSVVKPPEGEAKYGKAEVCEPVAERGKLFTQVYWALRERNGWMHPEVANKHAEGVYLIDTGSTVTCEGLTFRIDKAENAPHACPCCGRLVLPDDHSFAAPRDADCLGCFTWEVDAPAHLPQNSAHAVKKESK
ncbi:hypothetical protein [Streptomyces sp. 5-10]|uniref:hypothetical protein n=1 Tax=Streptomyces sp. 5-10 TaxID=878925 RepID=UPI00168B7A75|nr:hypothetical protein [Streptomyces sp. 5-10]MBD3004607.1 hypothetical protein [Streptomyces sp. 5-10]